jgi:hypothetical protein
VEKKVAPEPVVKHVLKTIEKEAKVDVDEEEAALRFYASHRCLALSH